jgi:hypothetical protein
MSCKFCGPANPDCPEPVEDMALTGASMLLGAGFPPGMTMGAAYRMLRAAQFELTLPPRPGDHEPGTDCPNSPHTCIICEPKTWPAGDQGATMLRDLGAPNAAARLEERNLNRLRLGGSSPVKSFDPDSPDFEGGH